VPERKYIEILLYDDILMSRGAEQKLEDNEKEDRNVHIAERSDGDLSHCVAPHPSKVGECFHGIQVVAQAANIAMDAVAPRPIGFNRHSREVP
jgi:hypothetical protein